MAGDWSLRQGKKCGVRQAIAVKAEDAGRETGDASYKAPSALGFAYQASSVQRKRRRWRLLLALTEG